MATNLDDARSTLKGACAELMKKPNVVATGVGYKTTGGKKTDELALICSVDTKQAKSSLSSEDLIPQSVGGVTTDVNRTGLIRALDQPPTDKFRPAPGGVSIGHVNITAGTLGCLVQKNGELYILSNNHVLANSNDASPGDPILQPGPHDGGQLDTDQIAVLSEFVPVEFDLSADPCNIAGLVTKVLNWLAGLIGSRTRLYQTRQTRAENLVDAAIAKPLEESLVINEIHDIGQISGSAEAALGMAVKKSGRTTHFTTGTVDQLDVTVRVNFGAGRTATFVDQLLAGPMSQGGDSGSAVLNDDNQLVGLLFAGSDTTTIFSRILNVFSSLNVTLPD